MKKTPHWKAAVIHFVDEVPYTGTRNRFNFRPQNGPQLVTILSQINPVNTPTAYYLMSHFNIIL